MEILKIKAKPQVEDENGLKMFSCEAEARFPMVIMAKDIHEARRIAEDYADDEYRNILRCDRFRIELMQPIKGRGEVPYDWMESVPYCSLSAAIVDRDVGSIIEAWEERDEDK